MFKLCSNVTLWGLLVLLLQVGMAGCQQDSIFDDISHEVQPTEPIIEGSPSKIVSVPWDSNEKQYVANGRIWEYDMGGRWHNFGGPGGYVADVAAASTALYAYTINNTNTAVWKKTARFGGWIPVGNGTGYGFIQNIYNAEGQLFATGAVKAGDGYSYAILYEDSSSNSFKLLEETGAAWLTGAGKIGSNYYLGTLGNGIYQVTGNPAPGNASRLTTLSDIAGFLQADSSHIIAISRSGYLLYGTSAGFTASAFSVGATCTGGLALTTAFADPSKKLLLIGIRGGTSSSGYKEVDFDISTGPGSVIVAREPGSTGLSSIEMNGNYSSSLKRYPVNHLFADLTQSPSVIFAATSGNGLYSYRNLSGVWQWNHEE
jgi:hypothetical protein